MAFPTLQQPSSSAIPSDPLSFDEFLKEHKKIISSTYGINSKGKEFGSSRPDHTHEGIDIPGAEGESIESGADGEVTFSGWQKGYGNVVYVKHPDGTTSRYGHLKSFQVEQGDLIKKGVPLGLVGKTGNAKGPHIHYERRDSQGLPIDPYNTDNFPTIAGRTYDPLSAEAFSQENDPLSFESFLQETQSSSKESGSSDGDNSQLPYYIAAPTEDPSLAISNISRLESTENASNYDPSTLRGDISQGKKGVMIPFSRSSNPQDVYFNAYSTILGNYEHLSTSEKERIASFLTNRAMARSGGKLFKSGTNDPLDLSTIPEDVTQTSFQLDNPDDKSFFANPDNFSSFQPGENMMSMEEMTTQNRYIEEGKSLPLGVKPIIEGAREYASGAESRIGNILDRVNQGAEILGLKDPKGRNLLRDAANYMHRRSGMMANVGEETLDPNENIVDEVIRKASSTALTLAELRTLGKISGGHALVSQALISLPKDSTMEDALESIGQAILLEKGMHYTAPLGRGRNLATWTAIPFVQERLAGVPVEQAFKHSIEFGLLSAIPGRARANGKPVTMETLPDYWEAANYGKPPSKFAQAIMSAGDIHFQKPTTIGDLITHRDPTIDGKPVVSVDSAGRSIIANEERKGGVSKVKVKEQTSEEKEAQERLSTLLGVENDPEKINEALAKLKKDAGEKLTKTNSNNKVVAHIAGPSGSGKTKVMEAIKQKAKNIDLKDLDEFDDLSVEALGWTGKSKNDYSDEMLDQLQAKKQELLDEYINNSDKPIALFGHHLEGDKELSIPANKRILIDVSPETAAINASRRPGKTQDNLAEDIRIGKEDVEYLQSRGYEAEGPRKIYNELLKVDQETPSIKPRDFTPKLIELEDGAIRISIPQENGSFKMENFSKEDKAKAIKRFRELGGKYEGESKDTPAPDWVKDTINQLADIAEKSGVANKIEDLSRQRLTAKQVATQLGIDKNMVQAVRSRRGIPSMDQTLEFEAWVKGGEANVTAPIVSPGPADESLRATNEAQSSTELQAKGEELLTSGEGEGSLSLSDTRKAIEEQANRAVQVINEAKPGDNLYIQSYSLVNGHAALVSKQPIFGSDGYIYTVRTTGGRTEQFTTRDIYKGNTDILKLGESDPLSPETFQKESNAAQAKSDIIQGLEPTTLPLTSEEILATTGPSERPFTRSELEDLSRSVDRLHSHKARVDGLAIASNPQANGFFKLLQETAKRFSPSLANEANLAKQAWAIENNISKATQLSEKVLFSLHQLSTKQGGETKPNELSHDEINERVSQFSREELARVQADPMHEPRLPTTEDIYGTKNKLVTRESYDQAKENIKKAIDPTKLNSIGDFAKTFPDLVKLGAYHIEAGAREFKDWAERIAKDLSPEQFDILGPKLHDLYAASKQHLDSIYGPAAVKKLNSLIREASKSREKTETLYTEERGKRIKAFDSSLLKLGGGENAALNALHEMSGELPKDFFQPVRTQMSSHEADAIYSLMANSKLGPWEKMKGVAALRDLLNPDVTIAPSRSNLEVLRKVYGNEMVNNILKMRSTGQILWEEFLSFTNIPRTILASFDLSAPFRQGLILSVAHPVKASRAFSSMVKAFGHEKYADQVMRSIEDSPMQPTREKAKLYLSHWGAIGEDIAAKEEFYALTGKSEEFIHGLDKWFEDHFSINVADKVKIGYKGVAASERAYLVYLNKLRADVFDSVVAANPHATDAELEGVAQFINYTTGRGDLGMFTKAAPLLNNLFFSPRFFVSRFQSTYLGARGIAETGVNFTRGKETPLHRKMAAKDFIKFVGAGNAILGLAYAYSQTDRGKKDDISVGYNPLSSDFGKIRIGSTRIDIWGGMQQPARYASQFIMGERISLAGERKPVPREEVAMRFLRSKESPQFSFIHDLWLSKKKKDQEGIEQGTDFIGKPVSPGQALRERSLPLAWRDIYEAVQEDRRLGGSGTTGGLLGSLGIFGLGITTIPPKGVEYDPYGDLALWATSETRR